MPAALPWIGVDLDGTLAFYDEWKGMDYIGAPVPRMVARVQAWLEHGGTVKIFTARVAGDEEEAAAARVPIVAWCRQFIGVELEVTNKKDFGMIQLWDDRAVQVLKNTGYALVLDG